MRLLWLSPLLSLFLLGQTGPPVDIPYDVIIRGSLSVGSMTVPTGSISDAQIVAGADISDAKVMQRHAIHYAQAGGTAVVTQTWPIHTMRAAGSLIAVEVTPIVAPTGGDRAFTIDVQKGNTATAFATMLTAPVTINSSDTSRTPEVGAVSGGGTLADGDTLQIVATAS
jgi:hypothetical protein